MKENSTHDFLFCFVLNLIRRLHKTEENDIGVNWDRSKFATSHWRLV